MSTAQRGVRCVPLPCEEYGRVPILESARITSPSLGLDVPASLSGAIWSQGCAETNV